MVVGFALMPSGSRDRKPTAPLAPGGAPAVADAAGSAIVATLAGPPGDEPLPKA